MRAADLTERFVARPSRPRLMGLVLVCLAFVAAGLWMAGAFGAPPEPGKVWVGYASILFFGLAALFGVRRLFDSDDQIVVDRQGIVSSLWSDRLIPWSAIRSVRRASVKNQHFLCLELDHPERYPSTRLLGRMGSVNKAMGFGDVALSASGTDRSFDELAAAVERFRPESR